jgi:hypothetical protein
VLAPAEVGDGHERPGEPERLEILDRAFASGDGLVPRAVQEIEGHLVAVPEHDVQEDPVRGVGAVAEGERTPLLTVPGRLDHERQLTIDVSLEPVDHLELHVTASEEVVSAAACEGQQTGHACSPGRRSPDRPSHTSSFSMGLGALMQ